MLLTGDELLWLVIFPRTKKLPFGGGRASTPLHDAEMSLLLFVDDESEAARPTPTGLSWGVKVPVPPEGGLLLALLMASLLLFGLTLA